MKPGGQFGFIYGIHATSYSDELEFYLSDYLQALRITSGSAKNILLVVSELDDHELQCVSNGLGKLGVTILTPRMELPFQVVDGQSLVIISGALPKPVFESLLSVSTLPVVLEGANTKALARSFGKPYIPIMRTQRTKHFQFREMSLYPEMHLLALTSHLAFFEWKQHRLFDHFLKGAKCITEVNQKMIISSAHPEYEEFKPFLEMLQKNYTEDCQNFLWTVTQIMKDKSQGCYSLEVLWLIQTV